MKYATWMTLDAKTREALVREIDEAEPEHDPRTDSSDVPALYTRLGRRSLVNDMKREFVKPPKNDAKGEPEYVRI